MPENRLDGLSLLIGILLGFLLGALGWMAVAQKGETPATIHVICDNCEPTAAPEPKPAEIFGHAWKDASHTACAENATVQLWKTLPSQSMAVTDTLDSACVYSLQAPSINTYLVRLVSNQPTQTKGPKDLDPAGTEPPVTIDFP